MGGGARAAPRSTGQGLTLSVEENPAFFPYPPLFRSNPREWIALAVLGDQSGVGSCTIWASRLIGSAALTRGMGVSLRRRFCERHSRARERTRLDFCHLPVSSSHSSCTFPTWGAALALPRGQRGKV